MSGFLEEMVVRRTERMGRESGAMTSADLERLAASGRPPRDLVAAVSTGDDVAVIAEVKKASPSAGPIAPECDAAEQALRYQDGGAAAISVLTEPESFGGSFTDLADVAASVDLPVLCKDFVVDPSQLFMARGRGADAVLLMVSVLGESLAEYMDLAATLRMQPLVEVTDVEELRAALRAGASLVAVNSRDLRTLEVDAARAREVVAEAASVCEAVVLASGTKGRPEVEAAAEAGADAVLVGEALMRASSPKALLKELTGVDSHRGSHAREGMDADLFA